MLHRSSKQGLICITQPNHAWLSGQLAQAWGNEYFGEFTPRVEVCLGAEQHDIGWLLWEQEPTLNPQTGYPHHFTELPTQVHIDIWSNAKKLALPLGRYVTLLVSLHGTGLYERFTTWQNSETSTELVQDFLKCEYAFQEQLIAILKNDKYYAPYITSDVIQRNKKLVATWDTLSILLCQGFSAEQQVTHVSTADSETALKVVLIKDESNHNQVTISPWPFQQSEVNLVYEGRLLPQPFNDETEMQKALNSDCWITLTTSLIPE